MAQLATPEYQFATIVDPGCAASMSFVPPSVRAGHHAEIERSRTLWKIGGAATLIATGIELSQGIPDAQAMAFFGPRALLLVTFGAALVGSRERASITTEALRSMDAITYALVAVAIALATIGRGGFTSSIVYAMACVVVAQGLAMPDDYWQGAIRLTSSLSSFFAAMLGAAAWLSPAMAAQFRGGAAFSVFAQHLLVLVLLAALTVAAGHTIWIYKQLTAVASARLAVPYEPRWQPEARASMAPPISSTIPSLRAPDPRRTVIEAAPTCLSLRDRRDSLSLVRFRSDRPPPVSMPLQSLHHLLGTPHNDVPRHRPNRADSP